MLAYAVNRPGAVDRRPHPNAMLAIIAVHVALLAAVMSAKMEFDRHPPASPILIHSIPLPQPPPPTAPLRNPTNPPPTPIPFPTIRQASSRCHTIRRSRPDRLRIPDQPTRFLSRSRSPGRCPRHTSATWTHSC